jgi:hypothetical protein
MVRSQAIPYSLNIKEYCLKNIDSPVLKRKLNATKIYGSKFIREAKSVFIY